MIQKARMLFVNSFEKSIAAPCYVLNTWQGVFLLNKYGKIQEIYCMNLSKRRKSMAIEDKDFVMRQVKQMAKGIGKLLGKDALKEIIEMDQEVSGLTEEEVDTILALEELQEIQAQHGLSSEHLIEEEILEQKAFEAIYQEKRSATREELDRLEAYIRKYTEED